MRARRRLGVVLDAEGRQVEAPQAFQRAVVEVPVGEGGAPQVGRGDAVGIAHPRVGIDGEPVVVAGDLHDARLQVLHRLVHAPVAELHLVGAAAEGMGEQLVAQADPEDRHLAEQRTRGRDAVGGDRRITGAVGQEHAVVAAGRHRRGGRLSGEHGGLDPARREQPQDVPLDPEVVGRHAEDPAPVGVGRSRERRRVVGLGGRHRPGEVGTRHARARPARAPRARKGRGRRWRSPRASRHHRAGVASAAACRCLRCR